MNNHPTPAPAPITLESIALKKAELQKQILEQKTTINRLGKEIFAPAAPAVSQGNSIMRAFNTGMAAFDGIMMGVKIMRKIRKIFR